MDLSSSSRSPQSSRSSQFNHYHWSGDLLSVSFLQDNASWTAFIILLHQYLAALSSSIIKSSSKKIIIKKIRRPFVCLSRGEMQAKLRSEKKDLAEERRRWTMIIIMARIVNMIMIIIMLIIMRIMMIIVLRITPFFTPRRIWWLSFRCRAIGKENREFKTVVDSQQRSITQTLLLLLRILSLVLVLVFSFTNIIVAENLFYSFSFSFSFTNITFADNSIIDENFLVCFSLSFSFTNISVAENIFIVLVLVSVSQTLLLRMF